MPSSRRRAKPSSRSRALSRRQFIAATSFAIVPRFVLGRGFQAPSDTLNIGVVGVGGMGLSNLEQLLSENIVALCDVDFGYVHHSLAAKLKDQRAKTNPNAAKLERVFANATRYADFRAMLEQQKNLDAVVVATPDHSHAPIAKAAMEAGKHVYLQKPLTYSVHEARVLAETARRTKVVTQMGNQGHSSDDARLINEWVAAGLIGPVHAVQVWTNRPIWPQGIPRPGPLPADWHGLQSLDWWGQSAMNSIVSNALNGAFPRPPGLDWRRWLGPAPDDVPYHPVYHPFRWRGWVDFGVSALGDMGAHLVDHPFWALDLGWPTSIEATSTPWGGTEQQPVTYPVAMTAHYEFPARGEAPPVRLDWYDGGFMPERPAMVPDEVALDREGGVFFFGEKGVLHHATYGARPTLYPGSLMEAAKSVPRSLPRIGTSHEMNWAGACKAGTAASCPFEYAARLTEVMLLGIVALRAGQGVKLRYDGAAMRITNLPDANRYLTRRYRAGWSL